MSMSATPCIHYDAGLCFLTNAENPRTAHCSNCSAYYPSTATGYCVDCNQPIYPQDYLNTEQAYCPHCDKITNVKSLRSKSKPQIKPLNNNQNNNQNKTLEQIIDPRD